jgi:hypothetical protein
LRNTRLLAALVILAVGPACFESASEPPPVTINDELERLIDLAPLEDPVWAQPDLMYAYHNGIVKIWVDSLSLAYRHQEQYEFPYPIWTTSYDAAAR